MEASLKEFLGEGKESLPRTDNKEDSDICSHFTIRGYVAGVRERDVRTCWPLFMPGNESSNTPANKLPPLHVPKFKRWNCANCLHTISTSEDITGKADLRVLDYKEKKKEKSLFFLNSNSKRSFSYPKHFSENIIHGERLVSDSSHNISHVEFNSDLCHRKQPNRAITEDVARGLQKCIYRNFGSKENQNWSCKPISVVAGDEFQASRDLRSKTVISKDKWLSAFLYHDASHTVCDKPNGGTNVGGPDVFLKLSGIDLMDQRDSEGITTKTKAIVKSDSKPKECKMLEVQLGASEDNAVTSVAGNMFVHDLVNLEQRNLGASYCKMGLLNSKNRGPLQDSVSSDSLGKVSNKKVRKLRFIEDIMKSEELHISKKICTFKGHGETCGVDKKKGSDVSKCEAQLGDLNSRSYNDGLEINQNKEEEVSLIHWLKKVSKKFVANDSHRKKGLTEKEYVEIEEKNNNVGIYQSRYNGNDSDPLRQGSKVDKCNKKHTVEKENKALSVKSRDNCFIQQQKDWVCRGAMMKKIHTGNAIHKMGRIHSANNLPPFLGNLDNSSNKKARRKMVSHVKCKDISQVKWSEKEIVKKRKTSMTVEKETLDDIPMDIVELLAKNQHERNLVNTDVTYKNQHELSMAQGDIRHGNDSYLSGHCEDKVSNAKYKSYVDPNDTGYDIHTGSCSTLNAECGATKSEHRKQILIDLNQQATEFMTIPQYDGDQFYATDLIVDDSKKMYPSQSSSWDHMRLQDLESNQKYQRFSAPCSSRATHHFLSSPLMGRKYGTAMGNIDPCCNHGKMIPYDSLFDRSQKTVSGESEVSERMNLIGSYLSGGGPSRQSTNARSYLMDGRNRFQSGSMVPMELHTNETVPALHLLRLVDQAAHSVASWDLNFTGNIQNSILNQSPEMLGMKFGLKIRETPENPFAAPYSTCDQNEGKFTKPYRPVPRVGDLGSLLQQEIMSQSNTASLGYKDWYYNKLPSFCISGIEKMHAPSEITKINLSAIVNNKKNTKCGDSFVHKFDMGQASISKMDGLVQSMRNQCVTTVNCIINRNPADFSLPDDDNVYMRGSEDQSLICIFPQLENENTFPHRSSWYQTHRDRKKWLVSKLPAVKG